MNKVYHDNFGIKGSGVIPEYVALIWPLFEG